MDTFDAWNGNLLELRKELETSLDASPPDLIKAELQFKQLNEHLNAGVDFAILEERYAIVLQEQLEWLQAKMVALNKEKQEMSAVLLQLERRKKAKARYIQNT